jgi:hypothetical protein
LQLRKIELQITAFFKRFHPFKMPLLPDLSRGQLRQGDFSISVILSLSKDQFRHQNGQP